MPERYVRRWLTPRTARLQSTARRGSSIGSNGIFYPTDKPRRHRGTEKTTDLGVRLSSTSRPGRNHDITPDRLRDEETAEVAVERAGQPNLK